MNEKVLKWLWDIKLSIDEIDSFLDKDRMIFEEYKKNLILKRATERNLEIIGEAMNRILKQDPDFPIKSAKGVVGLRNQIIHAYDNISDENIWAVIIKHLPRLKEEVNILIVGTN